MAHEAFKRKDDDGEDRSTLWDRITRPSKRQVKQAEHVLGLSRGFLDWQGASYYPIFTAWLQAEADKPAPIADHVTMIQGTTRANTFKEILYHLKTQERSAKMALGDD